MKKKFIIFIIVAVIALIGYGVYREHVPESEKILAEMDKILRSNESSAVKDMKIDYLKFSLAMAFNHEKKPDEAIEILEQAIKQIREPKSLAGGLNTRMVSPSYSLEDVYCRELAKSFELKGDIESRDEALKKAKTAADEAARLEKIEAARTKKRAAGEKPALVHSY